MKYLFRSIISTFFYLFSFLKKREGIIILMYHRVNDSLPPSDLSVPVAKFREQMSYLKKNYDVIGIEELLDTSRPDLGVRGQGPTSTKKARQKAIITFDDGYRDNYLNAYPILRELKLPATIFLITGMIGTDNKRPRYQNMPAPDMLSWDEVYEMSHHGITFGPHTVTHPHLSELNEEEQKKEIGGSIRTLVPAGPAVSIPQLIFCCPYGDYNADTLRILKELGVKLAVTIKPGINNEKVNPLELRRTEINGIDSMFDFRKKLAGAFDIMHTIIQKK